VDGDLEVGDPEVRDPGVSVLNATQASLLGFLHDGPATGWDLLEEARRGLARFWNVTSSHVYRELKTLETRGHVRAGEPGPRDRRPFSITSSGRSAFARWIRQEPGHEQMRIPLLVTLWFAKHLDDETLAVFLEDHRTEHERRLAEYRGFVEAVAASDSVDPHVGAVVEFGIAYEEAFLGWLAHVAVGIH
jgi:DNA-binding PadR family transcriptional regulator